MDRRLRQAWAREILAEDYDAHMADIGQAQANAELVSEVFLDQPPPSGAAILFVGAGTGQMFDYVSPALLTSYCTTFSDINPEYLAKLRLRMNGFDGMQYTTVLDDIEDSHLSSRFDLVVAVLVLEHVEWRKAVATICRLSSCRVLVVLQQNPPDLESALTPFRSIGNSLAIFREVNPQLLSRIEAIREFNANGFTLSRSSSREVLDSKVMVGLLFQISPHSRPYSPNDSITSDDQSR
jgi:ubiquinone/menaquinone biosynthesis C-methylase UbiE